MEKSCTLLVHYDKGTPAIANEIKEALEGNDEPAKIDAMKKAIMLLLNGETLPQLFISIVRYVLPSEDHTIQKLLLLYLEIIDKTDAKGKVLPEMILICQNLRNNLQHPNEYIRGVTLRFLCRLSETEIIEPLIPSVLQNLEHRHPYIRRNAILAVMSIYKLPQGEQLLVDAPEMIEKHRHPYIRRNAILAVMSIYKLPQGEQLLVDAPEMIEKVLSTEQDQSAKRDAFLMLFTCAQDRAINYLLTHVDRVSEWSELLQMVVLELIRKVCRTNRGEKGRYIKIILSLLNAPSTAVIYECAGTLVSLSSAPTAIRAAANTYCQLLSQSDNNVKLIVLDQLNELKSCHRDVMVDMIMDVLRALSSPNLDIRRKTLDIVLELITPKNINEVVLTLKKEVVKTQSGELEKNGEYRQMLIQAIHSCAIKFPEVASTVVHLLMDFLGDSNVGSAVDVIVFVREIIETNPKLRVSIITRLLDTFYQIRAARVCSCALWIIGEYCLSHSEVGSGIDTIKQCLGELPFYSISEEEEATASSKKDQQVSSITISSKRPAILADGTYATQSAASETAFSRPTIIQGSLVSGNLRSLLLTGDFFLGAVVACTLTKLVLRLEEVQPSKVEVSRASMQALLIMVSMLQLGQSPVLPHPIDHDSYDRIVLCIRLLTNTGDEEIEELKAKAQMSHAQPDDLIDFYHLKSRKGMSQLELEDEVQDDLKRATGEFVNDGDDANKLNRILQLTGFSDPVYAEAYVTVHHYDITLDVTVINRTKETLQNLCLELATMGDLKLVERPQNYTLAPESSKQIKANIKVSSTETGVIFGNIVYETSNVHERTVVVLNDIHIDIMDYISPAVCGDATFRTMWAEFEWENKVAVNTVIQDEKEFLHHIVKSTNMKCLTAPEFESVMYKINKSQTPHVAVNTVIQDEKEFLHHIVKSTNMKCLTAPSALDGACGFLAANLYAKSVFGEDALVNLSIEKQTDGKLSGFIRIRSKTQGIALSLGDKITLKQKGGS
ncbi:Coatomer subunit beta-1 [Morella rubra]|uniref:Coatomer subunit beta n=1 Tax=Morella rubra TaxID=262757 RepID=A0A6A1VNG8_9ROSI|nr:Coatomer subunit beta-1 [Morella rubra]